MNFKHKNLNLLTSWYLEKMGSVDTLLEVVYFYSLYQKSIEPCSKLGSVRVYSISSVTLRYLSIK